MEERARRLQKFPTVFLLPCALILILFIYNREGLIKSPLRHSAHFQFLQSAPRSHRRLAEHSPTNQTDACLSISLHEGSASRCDFLKSHPNCNSGGFINYTSLFYCGFDKVQVLGYAVLLLWLLALFYVLGNTAADYFCCSLAELSGLLNLPPTVAGVTLLPLGNGAPDVFASIAAFVGSEAGEVGLNSVLGGAVFVTCVVAGIISLCVAGKNVKIDRKCFIRDIGFFLLTLVALSLILIVGKVSVFGAVLFVFIYAVYAFIVAANEILRKHARILNLNAVTPLLPVRGSVFSLGEEEDESVYSSLLVDDSNDDVPQLHSNLPQWMWASNVAIYSNHQHLGGGAVDNSRPLWGWSEGEEHRTIFSCSKLFWAIQMPLSLPRKLTIPVVEEERWSRTYAVSSASLSPLLLAFLWNSGGSESSIKSSGSYVVGGIAGLTLGILAFLFTRHDRPPRRFLFPWVLGGFCMSIVWFYIVANELVALFLALGVMLRISPSILGLTVMAWGNSMGDLMSNTALALNGGEGVQIAISGCYAGPMFNTLAGLGISLLLRALSSSSSYILPKDGSLIYTIVFLMAGLIWSLLILPRSDMQPSKLLGFGLITIYIIFLSLQVSVALGIASFFGSH